CELAACCPRAGFREGTDFSAPCVLPCDLDLREKAIVPIPNSFPQRPDNCLCNSDAHLSPGPIDGQLNANVQCADVSLFANGNSMGQVLRNTARQPAPAFPL